MKRNAFTMIELIFVIVILGILGAVALPRLTATRDDATASRLAQNIMSGATEIAEYATAKGSLDPDLTVMSNGYNSLVSGGDAINDVTNSKVTVKFGDIDNCIIVQIVTSGDLDTLIITKGVAGDVKCDKLQVLIKEEDYPMQLRGQYVIP